jgi:hypothetical protein
VTEKIVQKLKRRHQEWIYQNTVQNGLVHFYQLRATSASTYLFIVSFSYDILALVMTRVEMDQGSPNSLWIDGGSNHTKVRRL